MACDQLLGLFANCLNDLGVRMPYYARAVSSRAINVLPFRIVIEKRPASVHNCYGFSCVVSGVVSLLHLLNANVTHCVIEVPLSPLSAAVYGSSPFPGATITRCIPPEIASRAA